MNAPPLTSDDQDALLEDLDIDGSAVGDTATLSDFRGAVDADQNAEFASIGEAIRDDLEDDLDADLIAAGLEEFVEQIDRLPEIREAGIPDGEMEAEELYRGLTDPAWRVYAHLYDVGFFDALDYHLPRFTEEHIDRTAHELLGAESLGVDLSNVGFTDHEQTVLLTDILNNKLRLSRWVPTREIPDGVEFDVDHVPPLYMRAMGGVLVWVDGLDRHLWQNNVLITETMLDDGCWDVKAMFGGVFLFLRAALDIADGGELTDSELSTALLSGAAIAIVNQEAIAGDVFRITDEMRAPSTRR